MHTAAMRMAWRIVKLHCLRAHGCKARGSRPGLGGRFLICLSALDRRTVYLQPAVYLLLVANAIQCVGSRLLVSVEVATSLLWLCRSGVVGNNVRRQVGLSIDNLA